MSESSQDALAILEPAATRVRDPLSGRSIWLAGLIQNARFEKQYPSFVLAIKPEHTQEATQKSSMHSSNRKTGVDRSCGM